MVDSETLHLDRLFADFAGRMGEFRQKNKLPALDAKSHVTANILLVTCIDCRYPHVIHNYMNSGGREFLVYDHLSLAGASLAGSEALRGTDFEGWIRAFQQHVDLAIDMHQVEGIMILDHRTCGAFKKVNLLTEADENTQREFDVHEEISRQAIDAALAVFSGKSKPGSASAYLTPEVTDRRNPDFPADVEPLHTDSV